MSAVKLKLSPISQAADRARPAIATSMSQPVRSPARQLQAGLDEALRETRWSPRRTLVFAGVVSASLWGLIIAGGLALMG